MALFDPLRATACDLQRLLEGGTISSFDIVQVYLRQIDFYGHRLHAVIQTTPVELLKKRTAELDDERKNGKIRGSLHGIPILIKVQHLSVIKRGSSSRTRTTSILIIRSGWEPLAGLLP